MLLRACPVLFRHIMLRACKAICGPVVGSSAHCESNCLSGTNRLRLRRFVFGFAVYVCNGMLRQFIDNLLPFLAQRQYNPPVLLRFPYKMSGTGMPCPVLLTNPRYDMSSTAVSCCVFAMECPVLTWACCY
eukprot:2492353-Rhodomonas_salina.4